MSINDNKSEKESFIHNDEKEFENYFAQEDMNQNNEFEQM
jgi:hypothetical protein